MKIDKTGGVDLTRLYQKQAAEWKSERAARPGEPRTGDSVELSATARQWQVYQNKLAELPAVREELVDRLQAEIRDGTYRPDPRKIAEGILMEWSGRV